MARGERVAVDRDWAKRRSERGRSEEDVRSNGKTSDDARTDGTKRKYSRAKELGGRGSAKRGKSMRDGSTCGGASENERSEAQPFAVATIERLKTEANFPRMHRVTARVTAPAQNGSKF